MKSKKSKIFNSLFLVSFLLCGCKGDKQPDQPIQEEEESTDITKPTEHQEEVIETDDVFYNGQIQYKVVTKRSSDSNTNKAIAYINKHISLAVESSIQTTYDESIDINEKNIVVDRLDLMQANGIAVSEKLQNVKVGYQIKSKGKSVFIYGTNPEGLRLGILKFLNLIVGYDCFGQNTYCYELNGQNVNKDSLIKMPQFDVVQIPDYQFRNFSSYAVDDEDLEMGFSDFQMNRWAFLPGGYHCQIEGCYTLEKYRSSHPEFYNSTFNQICYTARGNEESFHLMTDIAAETLTNQLFLPHYMERDIIPFCHCDVNAQGQNWCNCSACKALSAKYSPKNKANSVPLIFYMNEVARKFKQKMDEKADALGVPRRNADIYMLFYHQQQSLIAPDEFLEEFKLEDNLRVNIAPIQFKFDRGVNDVSNSYIKTQVEKWKEYSNKIGTWTYSTNFANLIYPYNANTNLIDYYRFFYNNGSDFMFNEGNNFDLHATAFSAFRDYIDSKALIDLSVNYNDLEEKFFKYYFGPAGSAMHKMYNEVIATCTYAKDKGLTPGGIKENNTSYWSNSTILRFCDYIDEAYDSLEELKFTDIKKYEQYKLNVQIEAVFPHYSITVDKDKDGSFLSSQMKKKYRDLLYEEATITGIDSVVENGAKISPILTEWGY